MERIISTPPLAAHHFYERLENQQPVDLSLIQQLDLVIAPLHWSGLFTAFLCGGIVNNQTFLRHFPKTCIGLLFGRGEGVVLFGYGSRQLFLPGKIERGDRTAFLACRGNDAVAGITAV